MLKVSLRLIYDRNNYILHHDIALTLFLAESRMKNLQKKTKYDIKHNLYTLYLRNFMEMANQYIRRPSTPSKIVPADGTTRCRSAFVVHGRWVRLGY